MARAGRSVDQVPLPHAIVKSSRQPFCVGSLQRTSTADSVFRRRPFCVSPVRRRWYSAAQLPFLPYPSGTWPFGGSSQRKIYAPTSRWFYFTHFVLNIAFRRPFVLNAALLPLRKQAFSLLPRRSSSVTRRRCVLRTGLPASG